MAMWFFFVYVRLNQSTRAMQNERHRFGRQSWFARQTEQLKCLHRKYCFMDNFFHFIFEQKLIGVDIFVFLYL